MLSLLKKKTEANVTSQVPAWHPNFRNYEKLPDIKVVRTTFFVNGAAILIASALLVLLGTREYEVRNLKLQIEEWQNRIDRDKAGSDQAIALYKKFQEEEKRTNEVEAFIKSKPAVSEFLQRFGETRPKNIALELIDFRENGITVRGTVRGSPDLASGEASKYLDLLKNDAVFSVQFDDVSLATLSRNPATGRLVFEILIKFKASGKEAKKA